MKKQKPLVGILLFPQVEVLDFAGPYEVLSCSKDDEGASYFEVATIAQTREVECAGGLKVLSDFTFDLAPRLDVLLVSGGPGARNPKDQQTLLDFIRSQADEVQILASVCTGSYLLARANFLNGRQATTHTSRLEEFRGAFPDVHLVREKVVDTGKIITAGGVSSDIDLALHLLERYYGRNARQKEARRLDGPWT